MHASLPSQLLLGNTSTFSRVPKGRVIKALNSFLKGPGSSAHAEEGPWHPRFTTKELLMLQFVQGLLCW